MSKTKIIFSNLVLLVILLFDRWFKNYFFNNPDVVWDFLVVDFRFWLNPGIAFGLPVVLAATIIITLGAILFLLYFLIRLYRKKNPGEIFFVSLIIVGAASNLADRLLFGGVIDYINFYALGVSAFGGDFSWPIFNLADAAIVSGAILWIIKIIWPQKQKTSFTNPV